MEKSISSQKTSKRKVLEAQSSSLNKKFSDKEAEVAGLKSELKKRPKKRNRFRT